MEQGRSPRGCRFFCRRRALQFRAKFRTREGRVALFNWFGGANGRAKPMQMAWHHLVFDEAQQIGAGEYTFTYEVRTHGMVMIRLRDGKIANWREYEVESPLDWDALVGKNRF